MIYNLSANERYALLSLLDQDTVNKLSKMLNNLTESKGEIVGFKRSGPFSIIQFIEQTTILKTRGYRLLDVLSVSLLECSCCRNKTCVSMEFCKMQDLTDSHSFELCLSCFQAVKETPVYASAEDEVQS